jgi:hypothetical protein
VVGLVGFGTMASEVTDIMLEKGWVGSIYR